MLTSFTLFDDITALLLTHDSYSEMQEILTDVESQLSREAALSSDHICSPQEVASAISKLNPHKNDGGTGLSSDHFIFAGPVYPYI